MISRAVEAEIVRLHHAEHWPIGTIAAQLRIHHGTVRRVLRASRHCVGKDNGAPLDGRSLLGLHRRDACQIPYAACFAALCDGA